MKNFIPFAALGAAAMMIAGAVVFAPPVNADPRDEQIARGKYLVNFGSCTDCHTTGYFRDSRTCRAIWAARTSVSKYPAWASFTAAT